MFIQTEETASPEIVRFLPGRDVLPAGASFDSAAEAARSPLAKRIFGLGHVRRVVLGADDILVTKGPDTEWHILRPQILGAIMDHFMSGLPVIDGDAPPAPEATADKDETDLTGPAAEIREIVETRIRPAAKDGGGDVTFKAFRDGVAYLRFEGPAYSLMQPIQNMLSHYVPEVEAVRDAIELEDRPGLQTEEGRAILDLLDNHINPQVAAHGGHISLVDVKDQTAFVRLEGGCQGCSASSATLRQGVEIEIKKLVPSIAHVVDVTDHASGANPYYS